MIRCTNDNHSSVINMLADRGDIKPITITWPKTSLKPALCNSMWAATEWLKANGFYEVGANLPRHEFK